jgi:prophage maintenance system killer protein
MNETPGGELIIYQAEDGSSALDVRLEGDTVWLTQQQMADLFGRDRSVVARHIRNAVNEREVDPDRSVQILHKTRSGLPTTYYDLDVIISVGYRVKSLNGVRFRRWATTVLRDHLVTGYSLNQRRLDQLNQALRIIARSGVAEVAGVASVLQVYADGLGLLDDYDHQRLAKPKGEPSTWELSYAEAREVVDSMSFASESGLFGLERDGSFQSSVAQVYQSFGGQELYPSLEEKAATLLYLVVKNHSFTDGNKRIAAALFVYFLDRNGALRDADGDLRIDNNALAAITLMIALSRPDEKDTMCALVMNFLAQPAE